MGMTQDQRDMLVDSVCTIDKWSKMGTISPEITEKIQQLTTAFYWITNEYDKLKLKVKP